MKEDLHMYRRTGLRGGASLYTSVLENMIVTSHHNFMNTGGILNREEIENHAESLLKEFQIEGASESP